MTSFKQLGLSNQVLKVIEELGFEKPSDIQAQTIPQLLEGHHDFIGLAQTGTGKTAAFAWPLLERIDTFNDATQALILAPTRELGQQIAGQLDLFSKYLNFVNVLAVYGGAPITGQMKALRKPQHIIIATPGRLIDLIKRKSIKLDQIKYVVLDEADEMLNMGFKEDIDKILSYTPDTKMTWLFSATMPNEIKRIVSTYMTNPIEVKVNAKNEVNVNIEHQFALVNPRKKTEALTRCLDMEPEMRGVVFCRTRRDTQNLAEVLLQHNYKADAIHGDLSQAQRDRVMKRFKSNELQLLVATDVAARGIDVNDLTHVFHFTLPDDVSYYTHRSGRTARAGKKGTSVALISKGERRKISTIERQLNISFKETDIPSTEDIASIRIDNWCKDILETKTKGKIDKVLIDKANLLFGNLSKEELTAKLLMSELDKLNLSETADITPDFEQHSERPYKRGKRGGGNRNRGNRSRNGGGRNNNGRSRSSSRKKKSKSKAW